MFVSSYNTYIQTNTSDKVARQRTEQTENKSKSFGSKLSQTVSSIDSKTSNLPVNYISTNQVLNNKQEIDEKQNTLVNTTKNLTNKFTSQNSLINAKNAYENNSKMFSLFQKPHATLDQTPSIKNTLPEEPMDVKESNLRHKMVNTYIDNDNYYKITA